MSTRTSKASKKTATQQASSSSVSTGEQPSSKTPQVGGRSTDKESRLKTSVSPTRISRLQEKLDLQNLNDRLAAYIDRVRYLETENNRLTVQVQSHQETVTREVTNVKSMYEQELSDARKLLDDTAKEKAKMQIEASKWKIEAEELATKYARKEKESADHEKQIISLETRTNELQSKYNQSTSEKKRLEDEIKGLQSERDGLSKQLSVIRPLLEEETLKRVDLENRLQSLKEELAFEHSVHEKQLLESRVVKQTEISEIDSRIKDQYNQKMADTLKELRQQYESQLLINRKELETLYETKMGQLQTQLDSQSSSTSSVSEELRSLQSQTQNLTSKVTDLDSQNCALQNRVRDLERMLEQERDWHSKSLLEKESEIQNLRDSVSQQMKEYQDLLDIKVALDLEIAAYRKLLESEEHRLNIVPAISLLAEGVSERGPTPVRRTPVRGTKRKRTLIMESERKSTSDKQTTSSAKGDVQVFDHCLDGRFVRLYNKGFKDVPLAGWQIIRHAGEQENIYKFHRNIVIKPDSYVTVWSSNCEATHSPPTDLVMKSQSWHTGDTMSTTLVNNNGQEMANRESTRKTHTAERSRDTATYAPFADEEMFHQQGDSENSQERCSVM